MVLFYYKLRHTLSGNVDPRDGGYNISIYKKNNDHLTIISCHKKNNKSTYLEISVLDLRIVSQQRRRLIKYSLLATIHHSLRNRECYLLLCSYFGTVRTPTSECSCEVYPYLHSGKLIKFVALLALCIQNNRCMI